MKLTSIKIAGYKSIDEIEIPVRKYGANNSYTTILLGKNETGKSNILDAMATPILAESEDKVDFLAVRNAQTEQERVSIFFTFDLDDAVDYNYREYITGMIEIPDELVKKVKILQFTKEIYLQRDEFTYAIDYDFILDEISIKDYFFIKIQETAASTQSMEEVRDIIIKTKSDVGEIDEESYSQLSYDQFKKIIKESLVGFADQIAIPVNVWKASSEYLIQDKIQLKDFAVNPTNIPLRNMFYLAGQKSKEDIAQKIADAEKNHKHRRKLANKLSKETTEYLNEKWKEHEIKIEVEIDNDLVASVFVKDKCDEDNYFDMSNRSQGFKQFVSLLLSISVGNTSGGIKDNLILIDEPEVHLHPSGIRYMLRELLEIGKNNYLFLSTHSNFMLDKDTRERHFLLTKNNDNLTRCRQIKNIEDINDDEVLRSAFGINVITDFLSPYKILVEGLTDKILLSKALNKIDKNHNILITNGTGSNLPAIASIMAFQGINPIIITDDDKNGRKMKRDVMNISNDFKEVTFTIRDLNGNIIDGGTIEDTLPRDYIESIINGLLGQNEIETISLNETLPYCEQLKLHLNQKMLEKNKKQKLNDILTNIKIEIVNKYDEKTITEEKTPKLFQLANEILIKFGIKKEE